MKINSVLDWISGLTLKYLLEYFSFCIIDTESVWFISRAARVQSHWKREHWWILWDVLSTASEWTICRATLQLIPFLFFSKVILCQLESNLLIFTATTSMQTHPYAHKAWRCLPWPCWKGSQTLLKGRIKGETPCQFDWVSSIFHLLFLCRERRLWLVGIHHAFAFNLFRRLFKTFRPELVPENVRSFSREAAFKHLPPGFQRSLEAASKRMQSQVELNPSKVSALDWTAVTRGKLKVLLWSTKIRPNWPPMHASKVKSSYFLEQGLYCSSHSISHLYSSWLWSLSRKTP